MSSPALAPQTESSCWFLGLVESISVDPVCLLASMVAAHCNCVPVFHIWQPGVSKWASSWSHSNMWNDHDLLTPYCMMVARNVFKITCQDYDQVEWAVGGITRTKTKADVMHRNGNFKAEHTGYTDYCSRRSLYFNFRLDEIRYLYFFIMIRCPIEPLPPVECKKVWSWELVLRAIISPFYGGTHLTLCKIEGSESHLLMRKSNHLSSVHASIKSFGGNGENERKVWWKTAKKQRAMQNVKGSNRMRLQSFFYHHCQLWGRVMLCMQLTKAELCWSSVAVGVPSLCNCCGYDFW